MPTSLTCIKSGENAVAMAPIPYPDQPGPGDALIRTTLSTICGTDIHLLEGMVPPGVPMGHEAVGIIEAVGAGVTSFKAGDRVVASCLQCCGYCPRCLEGNQQVCQTYNAPGNLIFGAQGQFFVVRGAETTLAKVPDSLDDEQVLFASDIMSTGFAAIESAGLRTGDTVAIFAQGPVGLCATVAARTLGAGRIITVESIPERVAMSKRMGADTVLDPSDAVQKIMQTTGGRGVDVAVEALGHQMTLEACCAVVRFGGTVSTVGIYGAHFPTVTIPTTGTWMHRTMVSTLCPVGKHRLTKLIAMIEGGKVDLRPLITHSLPLSDTPLGYEMFRRREGGVLKIALTP